MLRLHYNPSVAAYAVPPPFTQGRLWFGVSPHIKHYTEWFIEVRPSINWCYLTIKRFVARVYCTHLLLTANDIAISPYAAEGLLPS